ncbi:Atxe2 family lasso peptide isopeptidase [Caulobacter sp. RL271]|uniref:Atxe2 family lasso peptide isopeptidase n=1 Tax=Caulobacter segnis TaxID=88688 RepID=A0ABY4ZRL4_9CAUL|nr:Atxe2 family lasso peptide isopeptidase [Caulobacter segnis]USQ95295.1 Atxe2 family lasso peptide isopeptidase [Caulobacter segnis]
MRPLGLAGLAMSWSLTTFAAEAPDWAGAAFGPDIVGPSASPIVSTDDLVRMRDLGGVSVSPDGRWIAFSIYQGVPERNDYILRWFVQAADGSSPPRPIAQDGGQPIPSYAYGLPQAAIPRERARWSPDSRSIAFRRLTDRRIELWTADIQTLRTSRVASGEPQVMTFAWRADTVIFKTGLNVSAYQKNLEAEAEHGWLLDSRMKLGAARIRPNLPDCGGEALDPACEVRTYAARRDEPVREATDEERAALAEASSELRAVRGDGAAVELKKVDPATKGFQPLQRIVTDAVGFRPCDDPVCTGQFFKGLGWAPSNEIWFLKGESGVGRADGAPRDETALYVWSPSARRMRRVLRSSDLIQDCQIARQAVICLRETATRPRHIAAIDLSTGAIKVLADPNPTLAAKVYPRVTKIALSDAAGNPGFAHVVYPAQYVAGRKYPLVVTQYSSKGYLRGQVGNEYPIYPLSAAGYFVLSIDFPEPWGARQTMDIVSYERWQYEDDLRYRRNVFGAIDRAIDDLVGQGLVDDTKIAITGLSAGAEIVHYALQRSNRFAAAIVSSGAHDSTFFATMPEGARRTRLMEIFQSKTLTPAADNVIAKISWSRMPERLHTPLLINAGEYESLLGFEGIEALKQAKRPVEMRVFPDEMHIKYHPRSYVGVYDNNLMWLNFWLLDKEDPRPEFRAQYERWKSMRLRLRAEPATSRQDVPAP